jgi:hypothetical protein
MRLTSRLSTGASKAYRTCSILTIESDNIKKTYKVLVRTSQGRLGSRFLAANQYLTSGTPKRGGQTIQSKAM